MAKSVPRHKLVSDLLKYLLVGRRTNRKMGDDIAVLPFVGWAAPEGLPYRQSQSSEAVFRLKRQVDVSGKPLYPDKLEVERLASAEAPWRRLAAASSISGDETNGNRIGDSTEKPCDRDGEPLLCRDDLPEVRAIRSDALAPRPLF